MQRGVGGWEFGGACAWVTCRGWETYCWPSSVAGERELAVAESDGPDIIRE